MAATIKDVARETGLSLATISKYLNGGHVLEPNRAAIEAAVRRLGYSVNRVARGLKTRRSMTVGVLIPDLENVFATSIVSSLEDRLQRSGYSTLVCDYRQDPVREREKLEFLAERQVDGLVIMPLAGCADGIRRLQERGVPVVLLDRTVAGCACDTVLTDNRKAAREAVDHLLRLGHRRIGLIGGPAGIQTADERLAGYLDAHAARGIDADPALRMAGAYDVESGHRHASALLAMEPPPTALFVVNHEMTLGAAMALVERQVRIPGDMSVVGFDHRDLARVMTPPMSIVLQPLQEIGEAASELLLDRMAGRRTGAPVLLRLPARRIPGGSTGPPQRQS